MVNSINTNASSLGGLQNLQKSNSSLSKTQDELSSGNKVSSFADNAAILSVAQLLESDKGGLDSVKSSLDRALSSTDVALAAGDQVSDLLLQLKETAVQAADPGLDDDSRKILNDQFTAIRDQISGVVDSAEFNGTNAVKSGGDDIVALANDTGDSSITIAAQDLSLGGANVTLAANQSITTAEDATDAVAAIESSISNVNSAVSTLASGSNQFSATKEFAEVLQAKNEEGIGNLVDADLSKTSAQLAADEVKVSLGIATQSIANQSASNILQLF